MTPFADLHCHSLFSDGTSSPEEILSLALEKGFKGVSITDHDTIGAYDGLKEKAEEKGLTLLSGIEFSSQFKGEPIHILGYGFDTDSSKLRDFCEKHKERRENRVKMILQKLSFNRMPLTYEEVKLEGRHTIGRPHIAAAMMKKGYITSVKEGFKKFLGEGKLCYVESIAFSIEETIAIIHEAKGKALLAHPHLIERNRILKNVLEHPFDGIEVYYGNFSKDRCEKFLKLAETKNWLISGGSDFHGHTKPNARYGSSYVTEPIFYDLLTASR